jgi:hypothetical protein
LKEYRNLMKIKIVQISNIWTATLSWATHIYVLRWQLWGWRSHLFGNWQSEIEMANVTAVFEPLICIFKEFTS